MSTKTEEISLLDALSEARIKELPRPYAEKGNIWVRAIVRVVKCDNSRNYALAINDGSGCAKIVRDFGRMAKIVKVEGIYPYVYMSKSGLPDLRNKQEIVTYLSYFDKDADKVEQLLSLKNKDGSEKTEEQKKSDRELVKKKVYAAAVISEVKRLDELHKSKQIGGIYE